MANRKKRTIYLYSYKNKEFVKRCNKYEHDTLDFYRLCRDENVCGLPVRGKDVREHTFFCIMYEEDRIYCYEYSFEERDKEFKDEVEHYVAKCVDTIQSETMKRLDAINKEYKSLNKLEYEVR